jgi:hypothetical protein
MKILQIVFLAAAALALVALSAAQRVDARQPILTPNPQDVRFQLLGNEPIAAPDGYSVVNGWSVLVFKDRKAGQCYVAFTRGSDIAATQAQSCP